MPLLIVHLSSLDSYAWEHGQAAYELANALCAACKEAAQIVVTDQRWPLTSDSCARQMVQNVLEDHQGVLYFHHDEATDEWPEAMDRLATLLQGQGLTELRVGGVWASTDGLSGCVNATCDELGQRGITCVIDPMLCGYEDEITDPIPEEPSIPMDVISINSQGGR